MGDDVTEPVQRGTASTAVWQATCKDCRAERAALVRRARPDDDRGARKIKRSRIQDDVTFEYSSNWAHRHLNRGNTRSDRCERHRRAHRLAIQALAVRYIDLQTIGEVPDPKNPTGPLGGLGPLPVLHKKKKVDVNLNRFEFGMTDSNILEIIEGLKEKRVAVIEAGTGTGKSTFMPFRLINPPDGAQFRLSELGPIVVTEPRRAAATEVARFVGEELCFGHDSRTCSLHIGSGFPIGYQVRGDKNWDSACDLIYVTDGTMINWVRDGRLAKIGTVIVDEAHERSENIDLILALLKDKIRHYKHLRVIIASATLDKNFFVEYFGGEKQVFHRYFPAKKSFGYGVPLFVNTNIDDDSIKNGLTVGPEGMPATEEDQHQFDGWTQTGPVQDDYPPENLHETTRALQNLRCIDPTPIKEWKELMPSNVARQVVAIAAETEWGDILGFLPTSVTIRTVVEEIKNGLTEKGLQFDVYPLLSTTPKEISKKAIAARSRGDKRKIVIASNLAETSMTVKGIRYVVDSGLICESDWDPQIASQSFPTKPHSQSALRQRWGRVGRDAPGWVFPLYTQEQFLSLPRNTPSGSTQINLEAFYMKLISAGVNLDEISLPANFIHERVSYDQEALNNIDTFNKESVRARQALSKSGAVDRDGHLTEFGREVECFPGEGSQALAIMLADQLACVHEVALALNALGQGRLLGKDNSDILRVSRKWPAAWRVRAAQCHHALAVGCEDDLDVLLHVCALWQRAEDSKHWCETWWVNEAALEDVWNTTMATVEALSAAMKGEAYRTIRPELSGRARAVLTRAMASLYYENVDGTMFRPVGVDDAEAVVLSQSRLVDPGDRIIAFNRFRPALTGDGPPRTAIISHTVRVLEWAESDESGSDNMGLELLLRAATHLRGDGATLEDAPDPLRVLRAHLPVGTLVDFELENDTTSEPRIKKVQVAHKPFVCTDECSVSKDGASRCADPSGFDRDWDPHGHSDAEIPDEEAAQQLIDPLTMESNDKYIAENASTSPVETLVVAEKHVTASLPNLHIAPAHENIPVSTTNRAIIIGYKIINENTIALLVDPLADETDGGDPAKHDDLEYGQEVYVQVCGIVRDHEWEYLQLARADLRGYFYLDATAPGLNPYDKSFLHRLSLGASLVGQVVAQENNPMTVTLRPALRDHLAQAPVETLTIYGTPLTFYSGEVIEEPNQWEKVLFELDHKDVERGISHRFEIRLKDLASSGVMRSDVGQKLLVALEPDRGRSRKLLRAISEELVTYAEAHRDCLDLDGSAVRVAKADLPLDVVRGLARFKDTESWRQDVWELYTDSLHYFVRGIRPQKVRRYLDCPSLVMSLLRVRKREIQEQYGVNIKTDNLNNQIEIVSLDETVADSARESLQALVELPSIFGVLPENTAGMVLGKGHVNRKRLEKRTNVHWVWVDGDKIGVIGATANAVKETVRDIRRTVDSTTGHLMVPPGKQGYLIGKRGTTIRQLSASSGCRANKVGDGTKWVIEGPTKVSVQKFIQLASGVVRGATGQIISSNKLKIVKDTTNLKDTLSRAFRNLTESAQKTEAQSSKARIKKAKESTTDQDSRTLMVTIGLILLVSLMLVLLFFTFIL